MTPSKSVFNQPSPWPARLSWMAWILAVGLVLGRAMISESLREPFAAVPGGSGTPKTPGPAAALGLDLLCCLPAILVLLRRLTDRTFILRSVRSCLPLAALSLWMLLSTFWATDKFAALVNACHWTAAVVLLWATAQLVRDWLHLRLLASLCFALLPAYAIAGLIYQYQDLPELKKYFEENRAQALAERNISEGTFQAESFAGKLGRGEMMGFFTSANTFGAVLSLLLVIGTGLVIQRVVDKDGIEWGVPTAAVAMLAGLYILALTRSRGAFATLGISLVLMAVIWKFRPWLATHARRAFYGGLVGVLFIFAAVIGHGLYHHSLPTSTLTFRWQYWVGSMRLVRDHLLHGVGWANFGPYYLAYRLPQAPEEIKDPHNFLVRILTELGLIGGVLVIAWLVWLWWELTRPVTPAILKPGKSERTTLPPGPGVVKLVAMVVGLAAFIWLAIGTDWLRDSLENFLLKRPLFLATMILCASLIALRSLQTQQADDRPAPWILCSLLLGIGGMLIHNLIDFSLFEVGPMFLFALLTGSALGVRQQEKGARKKTGLIALIFTASILLFITGALAIWAPTLLAEHASDEADELIRTAKVDPPLGYGRQVATAMNLLNEAHHHQPLNAEYELRAAQYGLSLLEQLRQRTPANLSAVAMIYPLLRPALDSAVAGDPTSLPARLTRARFGLETIDAPPDLIRADFDAAVALDPNNVQLRLNFGDALVKLGRPEDRQAARRQYEEALRYDSLLNPDEMKRLTPAAIAEVHAKIERLK